MIVTAPAAMGKQIGQIKKLTGEVRILRGGQELIPRAGDLLEDLDTVTTGPKSSVGITLIDNSRFSLGPNSCIEFNEFRFNPTTHEGKFEATVKKGTLLILSGEIAKESPEAMKIKTRASILGVRGTRFLVRVDAPGWSKE
jgi:hypothetical protein